MGRLFLIESKGGEDKIALGPKQQRFYLDTESYLLRGLAMSARGNIRTMGVTYRRDAGTVRRSHAPAGIQ
jgi:hypothetical protein